MKKIHLILLLTLPVTLLSYGQVDIRSKVKNKTIQRADKRTDQGIGKGLDAAEEGIKNIFTKKEKTTQEETQKNENDQDKKVTDVKETAPKELQSNHEANSDPELIWAKYDFVPGDKIIFEDNQANEENGEFPSRWDLVEGRVENAKFDNEKVIYFITRSSKIIPYIKDRKKDYIPSEFTLEFDAFYKTDEYASYYIWFYDKKNQKSIERNLSRTIVRIEDSRASCNENKGDYLGNNPKDNHKSSFWRHVAISFNKRALKVYIDDNRVLNIPNMEIDPTGITIGIDGFGVAGVQGIDRYIKNVCLAEGAVKLYDKLQQDGKIVANGIRFDSGKSTIRPESMGIINKIYELMDEHPEMIFSIEGHTDNVGDEDSNQKLSEERSNAVMAKLINMGISKDRLSTKGFGESMPVEDNSTPEGRANNRRVEFVKI